MSVVWGYKQILVEISYWARNWLVYFIENGGVCMGLTRKLGGPSQFHVKSHTTDSKMSRFHVKSHTTDKELGGPGAILYGFDKELGGSKPIPCQIPYNKQGFEPQNPVLGENLEKSPSPPQGGANFSGNFQYENGFSNQNPPSGGGLGGPKPVLGGKTEKTHGKLEKWARKHEIWGVKQKKRTENAKFGGQNRKNAR